MIIFNHPIIFLTNVVKVILICLADTINSIWNPFDKFARPMILKYSESLEDKAVKFENNLQQFYHDGLVYDSTISWGINFDDVGDEAIWTGITIAMWAIKYSVTKDFNDLEKIRRGMIGLDLHQTAHGESIRRLIRGVQDPLDPKNTFIDDVSNDGATGHLLGIYYAWKYGDADIKQKAEVLIRGLADELLNHNYCLIGADGNPTTYGQLINGWKTDPLQLTLCMAILLTASTITEDNKYLEEYWNIKEIYGSAGLYKYPKVFFLTFNNLNDDHRAAIHLSILADLDVYNTEYIKGLKRIWKLNKNKGNAWVAYLCGKHFDIKKDLQPCVTLLNEFYVEDLNNVQKVNSTKTDELENLGIELKKYTPLPFLKGDIVSTQPLPLWWSGAQEFRYQRRPYSVDDYIGNTTPSQAFFGVDFLCAYWSFRQMGWIDK
jgi:hypothetical protein